MDDLELVGQPDHGRMVTRAMIEGSAFFACPICGRTVRVDYGGGMKVLNRGDVYAKHWAATADWLRFGGIAVKLEGMTP